MQLYLDTPTKHRVTRGNRRRVVYARHDWEGRFVRFVTHRSRYDQDDIRRRYYGGVKVGVQAWDEVQPWEIGLEN